MSNSTASTSPLLVSSSIPPASSATPSSPSPSQSASPTESSVAVPSSPSATPTPSPSSAPTPSSASSPPPESSAPPSSPTEQSSAPPSSTPPPPPSSTPVSIPSSESPPSSSAPPPSSNAPSSTPAPSSNTPQSSASPVFSTVTASAAPPSTVVKTSVITATPTAPGDTPTPITQVVTSVISQTQPPSVPNSGVTSAPSSTGTTPAQLNGVTNKGSSGGGLKDGGKIAIAVVVPVVAVAALVAAGIFLWRRHKRNQNAQEARRKEVEEYGFNPNDDPTLPAVGMQSEMAEDQSGYRGWGNTTNGSNRKASTTLTSGMTGYSDSNSNPGGHPSPGSPTLANSETFSNDPLMNGRRETLDSDGIGALGAGPGAQQNANQAGVHRGPSNASSSYSAANHSDNSGEYPIPMNNPAEYYDNNGYYQSNPYGGDSLGGSQQPVIRDVSARRNTRIENPSVFPQQGNSGIAQNF